MLITSRKLVLPFLLSLYLGACGQVDEFSLEPTSLRIVSTDDNNIFDPADEPYIGIIHFRAFFGSESSVVVTTNTDLDTLDTSAADGDVLDIAPDFPNHNFGTLFLTTQDKLDDGAGMWVAGAIYIGVDHDNPGKGLVRDGIEEIALKLEDSLVTHIAGGEWGLFGGGFWEALQSVMADLDAENDGDGIGGLGRAIADDLVGSSVVLYMGIEESYFNALTPLWEAAAANEGVEFIGCDNGPVAICPMKTDSKVLTMNDTASSGDYRLTVDATFE